MSPDPESLRFQTPDAVDLHVLRWSPRQSPDREDVPLVLLHGGGANAHWWDHLAAPLARERTVLALDFRGHGDSEHPERREVGAFNLDLEALVAWLGTETVDLVGHSLGAAVALDHASRFARTRSLVMIDPARGGGRTVGRRARLALTLRRTYASRAEAVERFRFLPESSHAPESLRRHIAEHSVREEPDGRFGYKFDPAWFGLPSRPRPDPADVRCPALLVRGGESQLLAPQAARDLAASLPAGRLLEIAAAGHHVLVDRPEPLLEALLDFEAEQIASGPRPSAPPGSP